MEDNCFTILCLFLPYISVNQLQVYVCPLPLNLPLTSHPTPQSTRFELLASYRNFHCLSNFTYSDVFVSVLLSQFVPPSSSPCVYSRRINFLCNVYYVLCTVLSVFQTLNSLFLIITCKISTHLLYFMVEETEAAAQSV